MVVSGCGIISGGEDVDVEGCESHRRRRGGSIVSTVVEGMGSEGAIVLGDITAGVDPRLAAGLPCECRNANSPQQACNRGV